MVRIVVQTSDAGMAVNIGGSVEVQVKTFDIDAPELETHLREYEKVKSQPGICYWSRSVIGAELLPLPAPPEGA